MKEKTSEKNVTKKIKAKNIKSKEQISVNEYANKLKNFKEELIFLNKKRNSEINVEKILNFQKNKEIEKAKIKLLGSDERAIKNKKDMEQLDKIIDKLLSVKEYLNHHINNF